MSAEISKTHHVRTLRYALEQVFNDAIGDDECQECIDDGIAQWIDSPDYAKNIQNEWQEVLREKNGDLAQDLILNWARQGKYSPEEAIKQLSDWYDAFEPLWRTLTP